MKYRLFCASLLIGSAAAASGSVSAADEVARVISRAPVMQQVGVPRQACATYATPGVPPQCSTQTIYESQVVGYNVVYERAGKRYTVQLPQDPGPTLRMQASGVEVAVMPTPMPRPAPAVAVTNTAVTPAPSVAAMDSGDDPGVTDDLSAFNRPYSPPVQVTYAYPGYGTYYGSGVPYYAGPVIALGFGGYYGGRHHYRGRGHRR